MTPKYIVATGSVGAGATTLAAQIADAWEAETLLEGAIEELNPFFGDAQSNPGRWVFQSQAHFLAASANRHDLLRELIAASTAQVVLEDRTPFEHHGAYSKSYLDQGVLSTREFELLQQIATRFERDYLVPDLLIYREMSPEQIVGRVEERSRQGESTDAPRLRAIHGAFEEFVSGWTRSPVLRVPHHVDVLSGEGREWIRHHVQPYLEPA